MIMKTLVRADGTARLWRYYASVDDMLAEAERKLRLVLSEAECQPYFADFYPAFCQDWPSSS